MDRPNSRDLQIKRILLVEDEAIAAMDLKTNLITLGYEVPAVVSSGEEAIRMAAELLPDLILMDITLDGPMDGIEAVDEIRKAHAIPIVFLTAHADAETIRKAKTTEPFGYLPKPCNIDTLKSTIEVALYKGEADAQRRKAEDKLRRVLNEQQIILADLVKERTGGLIIANQNLHLEIMERKRVEDELRAGEARYRKLFQQFNILLDAMNDTIILLSPGLEILWANKGAYAGLSNEVSDLMGRSCYKLWFDRTVPCEDCHVLKSFISGEVESAQIAFPGGRLFDKRAFPIKEQDGTINNVLLVAVDITEKTIFWAEAMRSAQLASLGELAAGVAHEINNPINGIINYAQIILDKTGNEIAGRIIKEGDRIAHIVSSLLSFSRDKKEGKEAFYIHDAISEAFDLTNKLIKKDNIEFILNLPSYLPQIIGHKEQIQQVILNLISNSRYALNKKYPGKHKDKILEITVETIMIKKASYIRLAFYDKGTGIPSGIMDKVINPFFTSKPVGEGTGLGLSISHGIIKDHGGNLVIESIEGEFTRVILDLPNCKTLGVYCGR